MSLLTRTHNKVYDRRVSVLTKWLTKAIPADGRVLDVGCGDGLIDTMIMSKRPDLQIEGIDVLLRPAPRITVKVFDGDVIPHPDRSFDTVMFVDVLHHTRDPMILLREAARVMTKAIVIKDHTANGLLAQPTLKFMDYVGNARHGVVLPYNFWTKGQWDAALNELGLMKDDWQPDLGLYPWFASWMFDRSLHFVARLVRK
jgi:SAM-dependent methyltransferase